jgi:hypothetical protein
MKPRFEPDVPGDANQDLSAGLIDPEAYDASEQQFAASLEPATARVESGLASGRFAAARFVVEDVPPQAASQPQPDPGALATEEDIASPGPA